MATYAVQFVTKEGAFGGSPRILNRAKTILAVQDADWPNVRPGRKGTVACVAITIAANNAMERLKMKGIAVSQVFHERARALEWLNKLGEEQ